MSFATIEEAIEDIRKGRMVIVVDDPDRENEGDLTIAAEMVTPEIVEEANINDTEKEHYDRIDVQWDLPDYFNDDVSNQEDLDIHSH